MEKETIQIKKIKDNIIFEKKDEVAVEYEMEVSLRNGAAISVTCTPTYLEEMILARRFLAGDLDADEMAETTARDQLYVLGSVEIEEIFSIAKEFFENPGPLFTTTGCAHSCALVYRGKVLCCIEDIGRHNALDKVIGYALKNRISIKDSYVFSSGRVSKDYLQKAIAAGFPMVVSRAAVTKEAAELAKQEEITLLGFIRKNTGNLYHEGKIKIHE